MVNAQNQHTRANMWALHYVCNGGMVVYLPTWTPRNQPAPVCMHTHKQCIHMHATQNIAYILPAFFTELAYTYIEPTYNGANKPQGATPVLTNIAIPNISAH